MNIYKFIVVIYLLIINSQILFSCEKADKNIFWAKTFGLKEEDIGSGDYAQNIYLTSNDNIIIVGFCSKILSKHSWPYKEYATTFCMYEINSYGEIVWGKWNDDDYTYFNIFISQNISDGGFIGLNDNNVIKITISGEIEWVISGFEEFNNNGKKYIPSIKQVYQTPDGGYVLYGIIYENTLIENTRDVFIIKLDSEKNIEWQKIYGFEGDDYPVDFIVTSNNDYILMSNSCNNNSCYIWILKIDSEGFVKFQKLYENSHSGEFIIQNDNDTFTIIGMYRIKSNEMYYGLWFLKINNDGSIQWEKGFKCSEKYSRCYPYDVLTIKQTIDGGYVISGSNESIYYDQKDYWIIKLSNNYEIEWQRKYGGDHDDGISDIQQISDGTYIVAGYTKSFSSDIGDAWIMRLQEDGTIPGDCSEEFIQPFEMIPDEIYQFNTYPIDTSAVVKDAHFTINISDGSDLTALKDNLHLKTKTQCSADP